MFTNIGSKIKGLATFVCWAGIVLSVIGGISTISIGSRGYYGGSGVLPGLIMIVIGSIASWLGSLVLYGFGQLVEDVSVLRSRS